MTLDEFVAQNTGKKVAYKGTYPGECVSLVKNYCEDVVGVPARLGNAKDYATNTQPAYFDWKINYLWYIPSKGSIAVWNDKVGGGFGHVSIVLDATILRFSSFDQNWPEGSPAHIQEHDYKNVAGFLVPLGTDPTGKYNSLLAAVKALGSSYQPI